MRLRFVRAAIATLAFTAVGNVVDAEAQTPPRPISLEGSLGVGTRVPGYGDEGVGPFASATMRLAPGRSGRAFLLGVGYAIVFTDGWTSPDGARFSYAPEAVLLHLGHEWSLGEARRLAIDVQWNPATSRVRHLSGAPPWATGRRHGGRHSPRAASASVMSCQAAVVQSSASIFARTSRCNPAV